MKFVIKSISKNSGRLGQLRIGKESNELQTPLLMQTTKGGSIPYLSGDVFDSVCKGQQQQQLLQLTLSTMDQMAESLVQWNRSLSEYVGLPGHATVLLLRDPCETTPAGGNDRDVVPLFTRRGKESLTATRYLELVSSFAPDVYQGLCDADTNPDSTKKRVQKSVDRTERFMEQCYERRVENSTLLAPIVGGYNTFARTQSIKHARQQPAGSYGGYILEGFHSNGLAATELKATQLLPIVEHCVQQLEEEQPRLMPGAYTPLLMLELIRQGIDIFDTSYAYCAAVNYKALSFSYKLDEIRPDDEHTPLLDMTAEEYKEQFKPLLSGCTCLACEKHTRAYHHHLYKTHELLGPILLMIHNLHHLMGFFDVIRASIGTDQLPALLEHLRMQNTSTEINYRIEPNNKIVTKAAMGKGFIAPAV
ncbi:queuine tRNA-ribosyltransferase accessory subunit 2 [Drosophila grimshawi]|uniref:Queuine tRNA-ribosyltransferase accessory subunit 2 n=1 Tax=Drosophila grimshawi TaxID=7222 RepID=QTRT2_DROGR|nr:queuine tRNA-ribosyltransferase accessory subunit 2 [Drosophila grimshawi]B4IXD3.1 RecName: Full=Queuine tRNA-ribosyltransferase accessory subunit 2; AltName: Full=Queuine tRNA-ribosyltransferase domain-containing protein 1 [Drosophila grimshawi]EDV96370.1 GH16210 [Drosophila grimshawi]